jgi:hypothetical protein
VICDRVGRVPNQAIAAQRQGARLARVRPRAPVQCQPSFPCTVWAYLSSSPIPIFVIGLLSEGLPTCTLIQNSNSQVNAATLYMGLPWKPYNTIIIDHLTPPRQLHEMSIWTRIDTTFAEHTRGAEQKSFGGQLLQMDWDRPGRGPNGARYISCSAPQAVPRI